MTRFGKLLVFTQLILSIIFFSWAAGLYSQRIHWAPYKPLTGGEPVPGKLFELREESKNLVEVRDLREQRWQTRLTNLRGEEARRREYLDWYDEQIYVARMGKDRINDEAVANPVRELVRGDDGLLLKENRNPIKHRGNVLKSEDGYKSEYGELSQKIDMIQKEIDDLADQMKTITQDIAGIPGKTRGMRGQLLDQNNYLRLHKDEMAFLIPNLNARRVETQVLQRRLKFLLGRRRELYAALGIEIDGR